VGTVYPTVPIPVVTNSNFTDMATVGSKHI
jgi:hypothetical protein